VINLKLAALLILFWTTVGDASGIMTISGTFYGKSEGSFQILSQNQVFTIQKNKLSKGQRDYLESKRWNQKVDLSVPMGAISDVHDKK